MNKKETVALFGLISALFPRDTHFTKPDELMRDAWAEMLADIPFDAAKAAIKASVATSPFPPSISEIRDYATRASTQRRMTAEEAWGIASELIRTYGDKTVLKEGSEDKAPEYSDLIVESRTYRCVRKQPSNREYEAKRHCPPEVWGLLERMGYADLCGTENPDVVRGQFMRAWDSHNTEAKEYRIIGSLMPELFENKVLRALLDQGVNGEDV